MTQTQGRITSDPSHSALHDDPNIVDPASDAGVLDDGDAAQRETPAHRRRKRRQHRSLAIAAGGLTAVGVAWAAAYTSRQNVDRRVGITAWIAATVIGTAATIAAARNS